MKYKQQKRKKYYCFSTQLCVGERTNFLEEMALKENLKVEKEIFLLFCSLLSDPWVPLLGTRLFIMTFITDN